MSSGGQVDVPSIATERLELVSMSVPFMTALRAGDLPAASAEVGAVVPANLRDGLESFLAYRLKDLAEHPEWQIWLGRAMVLTDAEGARRVVGTIGFHAPPDAEGRVEIGYSVQADFRRLGLATEAVRGVLAWAEREHGVRRFRAAVAPRNAASLAIVRSFGFRQVGLQIDDEDGPELVFHLDRD
jgi:RimJ/RimL family protein N-acetyltransferase